MEDNERINHLKRERKYMKDMERNKEEKGEIKH